MSSSTVSQLNEILHEHLLYKPSYSSQYIEAKGVFETCCKVFAGTHTLKTLGSHVNEVAAIDESAYRMRDLLGITDSNLFKFEKEREDIDNPYWKILCKECFLRKIKNPILLVNSAKQYKIHIPSREFTSRLSSLTLVCLQAIPAVQMIPIPGKLYPDSPIFTAEEGSKNEPCVDYTKYDKTQYNFPWEDIQPKSEEEKNKPTLPIWYTPKTIKVITNSLRKKTKKRKGNNWGNI